MIRVGDFFENRENESQCFLCPNSCCISEGKRGICLARGRRDGKGVSLNYGVVAAANMDPIEKKPLYHFFPGRRILSVGSYGCNLKCRFCQNSEISQSIVRGEFFSPEKLAKLSLDTPSNIGVAFTYNEPGIWYEYIMDCASLLRKQGNKIVLVTNGYLSPEPWENLCSVADAMNVDLKGFSEDFYRDICKGKLEQVLENIATAHRKQVHFELTNLVVTGLNDFPGQFKELVTWISRLSPDIPLHISRYFPRHHETAPETSSNTLMEFYELAKARLNHVFLGNFAGPKGNDTICASCRKVWIQRLGYRTEIHVDSDRCDCGIPIPIPGIAAGTSS